MTASDDHDLGLPHDLRMLLKRRQMLTLMASAGAAGLLTSCDMLFSAEEEVIATGADGAQCVAHPAETAGPFPADGSNQAHGTLANVLDDSGILRRDIRPDIQGGAETAAPGVRLQFTARLVNVSNACAPVKGHAMYLWHCDAEGRYSLYNLPDTAYLRGVGVSDDNGMVKFTTIVPGCYRGRYPHMHFEIYPSLEQATDYRNRILTSQLAIPTVACRAVYESGANYGTSLANFADSPLERDGIFADNTASQLAAQTLVMSGSAASGYTGEVTIGAKI
jgi:protocatechuate 3,4-dioxygenase beta subunit